MRLKESVKSNKILSRLTKNAIDSIYLAGYISQKKKGEFVDIDDLLVAIIVNGNSIVSKMFDAIGFSRKDVLSDAYFLDEKEVKLSSEILKELDKLSISANVKDAIIRAYQIAKELGHVYVGTEHLFLSCFKYKTPIIEKFVKHGINEQSARRLILDFVSYPPGILSVIPQSADFVPQVLLTFGEDLVQKVKEGGLDPLVGREEELEDIMNILSRRKKNNPLLVGEPGVGKTSIVEGIAQRIVRNLVPSSIKGAHIIQINVNKIVAGSTMRGDVEEKMMSILKAAKDNPSVILFFDDIHMLLGLGSVPGGGNDVASILKPELTTGRIKCIGVTTTMGYKTIFEDDIAFNRRFHPVFIQEPTVKESIQIINRLSGILEQHHDVKIDPKALEAAVKLSDRYVTDRNLPDKAIDLLDQACASVKIQFEYNSNVSKVDEEYETLVKDKENALRVGNLLEAQKLRIIEDNMKQKIEGIKNKILKNAKKSKIVTEDVVREVISKWTGIPVTNISASESIALKNLEKVLNGRIVGQIEAVNKVANAIKRGRTGITDEDRPWASFLFLGPTGVGKTELAKVLAKELFGDDDNLIQIDMSELMEMHSVSKLIGSPPGYIGYKEGGQLTERVKERPFSVVLFDEIEKAHEDVLNILLQILEYGHVTDGKGVKVNFKNTIIILTSNVGLDQLKIGKTVGFKAISDEEQKWDYDVIKEKLMLELKDYLRPELLNRLDDVIVFRPLTKKEISKIVDILVSEFNERISEQNIKISIDDKVKRLLLKEGFDQEYGARPLRRAVQKYIENVVADYIISNGVSGKERKILNLTTKGKRVVIAS